MSKSDEVFRKVVGAEVDGRARTPNFIISQLSSLHKTLVANVTAIRNAIRQGTSHSDTEIETEVFLTVAGVKQHASTVDLQESMYEEYRLERGEDAADRREGIGIVYVVPSRHTLLYSTVVAVSAAIAAGNCVIVELEASVGQVSELLHRIMAKALDSDTFAFVDKRPSFDTSLCRPHKLLFVDGSSSEVAMLSRPIKQLTPSNQTPVIAVVDRSASDLGSAAKALVRARASFDGKSPYAPDIVLVNEFQAKDFVNAVVTEMTSHLSDSAVVLNSDANGSANGHVNPTKPRSISKAQGLSSEERAEPGTRVVMSGDGGSVVVVSDRSSKLLGRKWDEPVFIIHPVSSMDDAIDYSNSHTKEGALVASYLFASPAHAKYLSQFIDSSLTLVNDLPIDLLVGPSAPSAFPAALSPRYTVDMFSAPRPALSEPLRTLGESSQTLAHAFDRTVSNMKVSKGDPSTQAIALLRKETSKPLAEKKRRAGKSVGFFDQGILTGLAVFIVPSIVGIGTVAVLGTRQMVRWKKS